MGSVLVAIALWNVARLYGASGSSPVARIITFELTCDSELPSRQTAIRPDDGKVQPCPETYCGLGVQLYMCNPPGLAGSGSFQQPIVARRPSSL